MQCGGWVVVGKDSNNKQGCYSCSACSENAGCSSTCTPTGKDYKGCNANGECLLCAGGGKEQDRIIQDRADDPRINTTYYLSKSCKRHDPGEETRVKNDLAIVAINKASLVGPGTIDGTVRVTAKNIHLEGFTATQSVFTSSTRIDAKGLTFDNDEYTALIMQNTEKNLDATLDGIKHVQGVCAGVVNSRGKVTMKNCNCNDQRNHTIVKQDPNLLPDMVIDCDSSCGGNPGCISDLSEEFAVFGYEYEVRYEHDGKYYRHDTIVAAWMLPVAAGVMAGLIVLLPVCHATMWRLLIATLSKSHKD